MLTWVIQKQGVLLEVLQQDDMAFSSSQVLAPLQTFRRVNVAAAEPLLSHTYTKCDTSVARYQ